MRRRSLRGGSVSPVPDWRAFVIAKNERSRTLYNFAREDNICCILLDFRPREGDIVPLLETNAHVIEKETSGRDTRQRFPSRSSTASGQVPFRSLWRAALALPPCRSSWLRF